LGYIADDELMQLRKLGRHWHQLSRLLSRSKHSMRSMLLAANIAGPKLDGHAAQKWILARGDLLKPVQQQAFVNFLDIIQLVERQRARLHLQITFANRAKRFCKTVELLKSVPGIDEIWGCIIAAEIGPFDRFPNADALEFWAGMTADLKESAGRRQSGNITKAGSRTLRWALCKAGVTLCFSDAKQETVRQRLIKRTGGIKPKANVAMGRRLLRTLYAMVTKNTPYHNAQPVARNLAANKARAAKRARKPGKGAA
jgi:transposase